MNCDSCSAQISDVMFSHSVVIVLQKLDSVNGYSWMQCNQGTQLKTQHCYCSEAHMVSNIASCINTHYSEANLVSVPISQVSLHSYVFNKNPVCKVCGVSLNTVAYRFCLTHATPVTLVADTSNTEMGEWCCSFAHAQQSALAIIGGINATVPV